MGKRRWRKRPITVDAVQYDGSDERYRECCKLAGVHLLLFPEGLSIPTLEGTFLCSVGDWLIKGVKGECYPCKPDVFAVTYEAVEEEVSVPTGYFKEALFRVTHPDLFSD